MAMIFMHGSLVKGGSCPSVCPTITSW